MEQRNARLPVTQEVAGSNPVGNAFNNMARYANKAERPGSNPGGWGFESLACYCRNMSRVVLLAAACKAAVIKEAWWPTRGSIPSRPTVLFYLEVHVLPKLKSSCGYLFIKELGGAIRRRSVSRAANWLVQANLIQGRVLDYGCGFGFDADSLGWDAFDPYYRSAPLQGEYDTIVCNHVLNMLTRSSRTQVIASIQQHLQTSGTAWLAVPRNIPCRGKVGLRKRIQNYVILDLPSVWRTDNLEIYKLRKKAVVIDRTDEIELRLSGR